MLGSVHCHTRCDTSSWWTHTRIPDSGKLLCESTSIGWWNGSDLLETDLQLSLKYFPCLSISYFLQMSFILRKFDFVFIIIKFEKCIPTIKKHLSTEVMQYEHELSPIKPIDDLLDGSELENCMFDVLLGNNDGIGIYISGRQFSCPFCLFVLSVFDTGYSDDYYSNDECAEEANDSDERCV